MQPPITSWWQSSRSPFISSGFDLIDHRAVKQPSLQNQNWRQRKAETATSFLCSRKTEWDVFNLLSSRPSVTLLAFYLCEVSAQLRGNCARTARTDVCWDQLHQKALSDLLSEPILLTAHTQLYIQINTKAPNRTGIWLLVWIEVSLVFLNVKICLWFLPKNCCVLLFAFRDPLQRTLKAATVWTVSPPGCLVGTDTTRPWEKVSGHVVCRGSSLL